jgi:hypothetical protein
MSLGGFGAFPGLMGGLLAAVVASCRKKPTSLVMILLYSFLAGFVFGLLGAEPLLVLMTNLTGVGP